jgi:predicted SprT family Zn-dependent metalloprotease
MDAFWSQDAVNQWNDEYSPRKTLRVVGEPKVDLEDDLGLNSTARSPKKNRTKHNTAIAAKKSFSQRKHELAVLFLNELDQAITSGQVSEMAAATGGVNIIWSKTLKTTAGRANWRREVIKPIQTNIDRIQSAVTHRHFASIELAEKVIDDEDRLLNVIAHEFCHLANFMVSGVKNNPHGKEFKAWAAQCCQKFGHRGVEVTTKHSYVIDYKYIWECSNCGLEYKRHSKSVDPVRHRCGKCKDKLIQTKPVPRLNTTVNEYQAFVKENMKRVRDENPGSPQKEIMGLVGKKYQEYKASRILEETKGVEIVGAAGQDDSSDIDAVSRKLNFLDLRSP